MTIKLVERLVFVAYAGQMQGNPPSTLHGWASRKDRLDIIARVLLAALYPAETLLRSNSLLVVFDNYPVLVIRPSCLPHTLRGEMEARKLLLDVFKGRICSKVNVDNFDEMVGALQNSGYYIYLLSEDGEDIFNVKPWRRSKTAYIVGTRVDPPRLQELPRLSIGPHSYLASHVVAFINYLHQKCSRRERERDDDG